jgi:hypothetical protein
MLAVAAGAFLLVIWGATKAFSCSSVIERLEPRWGIVILHDE